MANYTSPQWANDQAPKLNATNMQAITDKVEESQVLKGTGAPDNTTAGAIGQKYADTSTTPPTFYECTDDTEGAYEWKACITDDDMAQKANIDGAYDDMTVGNAEQLVSTVMVNDKAPYLYRTSGGSADIGNREYDTLVGGTVAWNQLCTDLVNSNFSSTTQQLKYSGTGNSLNVSIDDSTKTATLIAAEQREGFYYTYNILNAHVYFSCVEVKTSTATTDVILRTVSSDFASTTATTDWQSLGCVFKSSSNRGNTLIVLDNRASDWDAVQIRNFQAFDLTQMFGTTIADYIYGLEQANAGAGVAWFKALFPEDYYPYNAGTLLSVSGVSAHQMTGFNQWDEQWELGDISSSTGENVSASTLIRSKNYISIIPSASYYFMCAATQSTIRARFYDADKNYIGNEPVGANNVASNQVFVAPSNSHYMRFAMQPAYGTTYNNDICINLSWSGYRNGEYEPYVLHSYPLDSDLTIRGVPLLDADNKLYYDGDTYEADGTVTRKYGIVDLGTLEWSYSTSPANRFIAQISGIKDTNRLTNMICSKYIALINEEVFDSSWDKVIYEGGTTLYVHDSSYTDAATFKTAMSGVYLVYELATTTTETADAFQSPQIVDDFGTERYVVAAQNGVEVPVGHSTEYPANLRDKLQHLPDLAENDGLYLIRQQDSDMTLTEYTEPVIIEDCCYEGVDLTVKFASEIAASPYSGDAWAWIKARIQAGNFGNIRINDYIPFTANGATYKACVAGINTYKNYGDTAVGNHIDFICRELWATRHVVNPVNLNNGTNIGGNLIEYPWLASDLYLFLNSLSGNVASEAVAGGGTGTAVDYTSGGVYYYLPTELKNVIVEKRAYLPKRYDASSLLSDDNAGGWANIGKLWLPSECEVYGAPCWGGKGGYSTMGNNVQYPIFAGNMNRVKNRSGSRDLWWVLSAYSGNTSRWCIVSYDGYAHYGNTSYTLVTAPVCFRIA